MKKRSRKVMVLTWSSYFGGLLVLILKEGKAKGGTATFLWSRRDAEK